MCANIYILLLTWMSVGKNSWPELVGEKGEIAAAKIEEENHTVHAHVVVEGDFVIKDYRCTRVWVWVNNYGFVTRVPKIG